MTLRYFEFSVFYLKLKFHIKKYYSRLKDKMILELAGISSHRMIFIKDTDLIFDKYLFDGEAKKIVTEDYEKRHAELIEHYLNHEFNFLGTGWIKVKRSTGEDRNESLKQYCLKQNYNSTKEILELLWNIDKTYELIDWQTDFKNNYTWNERLLSKDLKYRKRADIKIPWELGRFQHLPQLALCFGKPDGQKGTCGNLYDDKILTEFKTQILDFIAFNPPKYGVQWFHSMDVGIRVANWLIAFDILKNKNVVFEEKFLKVFIKSIYEHGHHIYNNLERYANTRANHYFANVIGLLFICYYLPENGFTKKWSKFATISFIEEMNFQFWEDGSNIEGSAAYHRLVSEFALWGTIIIEKMTQGGYFNYQRLLRKRPELNKYISDKALPNPDSHFFPNNYYGKLYLIYQFLKDVTEPDGTAWLIGDNDSGRLFKFTAELELFTHASHKDDICESPHFNDSIAMFAGMFGEISSLSRFPYYLTDAIIVASIYKRIIMVNEKITVNSLDHTVSEETLVEIKDPDHNQMRYEVKLDCPLEKVSYTRYPDFGIYIFRTPAFYLGVRCGGQVMNNIIGHRHKDQLTIELFCNNKHIIRDPGMPAYTSDIDLRDYYRSGKVHFIPNIYSEKESLNTFLYASQVCKLAGDRKVIASVNFAEDNFYRIISISENKIMITDRIDSQNIYDSRQLNSIKNVMYSPSYGTISDKKSIDLNFVECLS